MSSANLHLPGGDDQTELDASALQGSWTEEQYLRLTDHTNRLVELVDGRLEVLPMPTDEHQGLLEWLSDALRAALGPRGVVRVAPLRLRLPSGRFREPDILALRDAGDSRRRNRYWHGADLIVEIVSPDDPARDLVIKRAEYAAARVPEYWIVDPRAQTVTVLRLAGESMSGGADQPVYVEHGVFERAGQATSALLEGFMVDVAAMFVAATPPPD
jgi:Uma2 family endonuclease